MIPINYDDIFIHPTDTIYGIGCNALNKKAIDKIFHIKKRKKNKSFIVLVNSENMLKKYVDISEKKLNFIKNYPKPLSVIYKNVEGLAENIYAKDKTVAIRIVNKNCFCNELIEKIGTPIVSTSANISGENSPKKFNEISDFIINSVNLVFKESDESKMYNSPSDIVKILEEKIIYVRKIDLE